MTARQAKASSSIHYHWTYDVFLNFRGEDTRHGFTGHLYDALNKMGIRTFFDDKEIRIGDKLTPTLLKAIQESRMAITVFSEEYASSTFCLDELVEIHQCVRGIDRLVWPIFYNVEPSEVRHQRGKYGQALVTHEQNSRADEEKIKKWKHALHEVANLKGSSCDTRKVYEHEVIKEIVNHIVREIIKRGPLDVAKYPVGLTSRLETVCSRLQLGSNDKVMIGICGIGGMGKTTIVRAVYNAIANHFDYLCFLDDIKGESEKFGLQQQQAKMLSKILGKEEVVEDVDAGVRLIKRVLKGKKTLLILDNVDEQEQLQKLAGECEWFGAGSRIIITTRDSHLLKIHGVERIYGMEALNHEESLELLSWMAFRNMQVDQSYKDVMKHVIRYASGLPLALELIGSDLYGKNVKKWESRIDGFKTIPHDKIQQILRVSYNGLEEHQQEAFLDIACFYNGSELKYVNKMVAYAHGFDPHYHIGVLEEKCLLTIEKCSYMKNCIKMHDLVQDMGREIVRRESPKYPGKRSRLWSSKDIVRVLEGREGTSEVINISQVESSKRKKRSRCEKIDLDGKAFKSMKNLKILILKDAEFSHSQGPKYLPNSLAVLRWRGYPSSSLPDGFRPKDLVEFDMSYSNIKIMEPVRKMANVSVMNFSGCKHIKNIPNLSSLSSLKELLLSSCTNLIGIDNSVGQLPKLKTIDVSDCTQLRTLPSELNTPSLVNFNLMHCGNLNFFPEIGTREMKISHLSLKGTGIDQLPPSFENLTKLRSVCITTNSRVRSMKLPSSTFMLPELTLVIVRGFTKELIMEVESIICPNIKAIDLINCNISNENLRIYLAAFSNVRFVNLTGSDFTILPACIEDCRFLDRLVVDKCKHLIEVEMVPPSIMRLSARDCTSLSSESRKLLLSKELLASIGPINHEKKLAAVEFCVPGGSIPEWFDHCSKGPSISFWFFDQYFPTYLIMCAVVKTKGNLVHGEREVFINEEACTWRIRSLNTAYDEEHIIVDYIWKFDIDKSYAQRQWKHAKICLSLWPKDATIKESGIYVIRDERTNMENIRFTDPFQCSNLLTNE